MLWDCLYSPWLHVWIPDLALNLKYKKGNFTGLLLEGVQDILQADRMI